jgi:hypothetical protein
MTVAALPAPNRFVSRRGSFSMTETPREPVKWDVGAACEASLWVEQDQLLCEGPSGHHGSHYATVSWETKA